MIPRLLHHIWIGPKKPPMKWINTWKKMHPHWPHILWDNKLVMSRRWHNHEQIKVYLDRKEWPGAADLLRYEILYEYGGWMPGADSICLRPIEPILTEDTAYTAYENEIARPGLITPVQGANPGNIFLRRLIDSLHGLGPADLGEAWTTTGNALMKREYKQDPRGLVVWPSYYLNPEHYTGIKYGGTFRPFARQMWGSTKKLYK